MAAYIALEEINFIWPEDQVNLSRLLWKEGASLLEISDQLKRKPIEVFLLLLDQAHCGRIKGPVGSGFYEGRGERS